MSNVRQTIRAMLSHLEPFVVAFSLVGVIAYILDYIISLNNHQSPIVSPIDLAGVSATLGGLILVGGFFKENTDLGQKLKRSARLLLYSSVFFIISFFLLEAVFIIKPPTLSWTDWVFIGFTDFSIAIAGVFLCFALGRLVRVLPLIQ